MLIAGRTCRLPTVMLLTACLLSLGSQATAQESEQDQEFGAATARLAKGNVEKYVALGWLDKGRQALDSASDPLERRGDYGTAIQWAKLALDAVADRPYTDLYFHIVSEHVRICNHAGKAELADGSLKRLREYQDLDRIRLAYIDLLALYGPLLEISLPDGSLNSQLLERAYPGLAEKLKQLRPVVDSLQTPEQADQWLFDCWQRLQIAWGSIHISLTMGEVNRLATERRPGWKAETQGKLSKGLLQRVWFVDENRFPRVAAASYLRLYRFYQLYGNITEILQSLSRARRLSASQKDRNGLAAADLAEAEAILTPGGAVDSLGVLNAPLTFAVPHAPLASPLVPPVPSSAWEDRADQVRTLMMKAEVVFRDTKSRRGLAATYLRQGYLESRLGRADEAEILLGRAGSVSLMAGDERGRFVARFHVLVNQLRANRISDAQATAGELLTDLEETGSKGLALGFSHCLLGLVGRDFSRFATPNQQTATLRLSVRFHELVNDAQLMTRHLVEVVRVAARLPLFDLAQSYANRTLKELDSMLGKGAGAATIEAVKALKAVVAHSMAEGYLKSMDLADESVRHALMAIDFAKGTPLENGPPGRPLRTTLLAAYLHAHDYAAASKLVPADDADRGFEFAMLSADFGRAVATAKRELARARKKANLPDQDQDQQDLTRWIHRLARALLKQGNAAQRAKPGTVPPQFAKAKELVDEWKELSSADSGWQREPWWLLYFLGQVTAGQNQPETAWMLLSGALQAVKGIEQKTLPATRKEGFAASVDYILNTMLEFLVDNPETPLDFPGRGSLTGAAAALTLLEERENVRLGSRLATAIGAQGGLVEPEEATALEIATGRARDAELQLARLDTAGEQDPESMREAKIELDRTLDQLARAKLLLDQKYPRFAFARAAPGAFAPEEAIALARNRQLTLLVYRFVGNRGLMFVVDGDGIRVRPLAQGRRAVEQLANKLADSLAAARGGKGKLDQKAARDLYRVLLEPAGAELPVAKSVCIVPDGVLFRVPFGALKAGDTWFLERNPYFVAPSLTALLSISTRTAHPNMDKKVLMLADPEIGRGTAQGPGDTGAGLCLALPVEEMESPARSAKLVEEIADLYRRKETSIVLGNNATELFFKRAGSDYGIIHLTCPVVTDKKDPSYSGLVLTPAPTAGEDGFLQAWEITQLELNTGLVILSAYDTGLGSMTRDEGSAGLVRAFLSAGTPAFVATLTPTNDQSAAVLMPAFYTALRAGKPVHRALQEAALAVKSDPRFAGPENWAGYVAYGLADIVVSKED